MNAPRTRSADACNAPAPFPSDRLAYEHVLQQGQLSRASAVAEGRYMRALHSAFTEGLEIGLSKGLSIGEQRGRRWGLMFGAATTLTAALACLGAYLLVTQ